MLTTIVASANHADKTTMLLGKGTFVKEQEKDLLGWLLVAVRRHKDKVIPSVVGEIIYN